jgi:hypothetical protein
MDSQMNYAMIVNHHIAGQPRRTQGEGGKLERSKLTLIEIRDRGLALHSVLLLSVLLVRVISFDVVPRIELEHVVVRLEVA